MSLIPLVRFCASSFVVFCILTGFEEAAIAQGPTLGAGGCPYDDFQDGTDMNWIGANPVNAPDQGPGGAGDHCLLADADGNGPGGRLVIFNETQWAFNWTANGIAQIKFDIRNPNTTDLTIRLGLAGDGFPGPGGSGPTFISNTDMVIPADNAWYSVTFDVLPADWSPFGGESTIEAALADVTHFRIIHNPTPSFIGFNTTEDFFIDNIRPVNSKTADSYRLLLGTPNGGTLEDTFTSDDVRLCMLNGQAFSPLLPSLITEFEGALCTDSPNALAVQVEAQVNDFGLEQAIQCLNFNTGQFETVDTRDASRFADQVVTVQLGGDITRFVEAGTGKVKMRVTYKSDGTGFFASWQACIDQLSWEYE